MAAAKRVDQTQTITYNFGQAVQVASNANANAGMVLPKTGDMSTFVPAFWMVSVAAVTLYNRKRR